MNDLFLFSHRFSPRVPRSFPFNTSVMYKKTVFVEFMDQHFNIAKPRPPWMGNANNIDSLLWNWVSYFFARIPQSWGCSFLGQASLITTSRGNTLAEWSQSSNWALLLCLSALYLGPGFILFSLCFQSLADLIQSHGLKISYMPISPKFISLVQTACLIPPLRCQISM